MAVVKFIYCDFCEHKDSNKENMPCLHCLKNKNHGNFFKEISAVSKLKESVGFKEEIMYVVTADE